MTKYKKIDESKDDNSQGGGPAQVDERVSDPANRGSGGGAMLHQDEEGDSLLLAGSDRGSMGGQYDDEDDDDNRFSR